jgi:hypothetical protein
LLRNEKWKLRRCERQTEMEERCEDDRLQETRENTRNRKVTINLKGKTKAE